MHQPRELACTGLPGEILGVFKVGAVARAHLPASGGQWCGVGGDMVQAARQEFLMPLQASGKVCLRKPSSFSSRTTVTAMPVT